MNKQEVLSGVSAEMLPQVIADYESEGAQVTFHKDADGTYTVTATWPDVPATLMTPKAIRNAAAPAPSSLTATQAQTAQAIVNVFETGGVLGDYAQVTLIPHDTGRLTYGKAQTTLGSGNLATLLHSYCAASGDRLAKRLAQELPRFDQKAPSLDTDAFVQNLLRAAADDPVMRDTQDDFFDTRFWQPALKAAAARGVVTPLGCAIVYDGFIQGSWQAMSDKTDEAAGKLAQIGEKAWMAAYVDTRRTWLVTNARSDLRATVYRMDQCAKLIAQNAWTLDLPLVVRSCEISAATLAADPGDCYDGPQPGTRGLALASPLARGLDVRRVQLGLSQGGAAIKADGIFGQASRDGIAAYQTAHQLPVSGTADAALVSQLAW